MLEKEIKQYKDYLAKKDAYDHAFGVLEYDSETVMPRGGADELAKTMGVLSEEMYKMETSDELKALVNKLYDNRDCLDLVTRREIEEHKEAIARIDCIPMKEYVDYEMLISKTNSVWEKAKRTNDYNSFKPYLKQIVDYNRKFALYYAPNEDPYDTLLDQYEKGLNQKTLDNYFSKIAKAFKPLVEKASQARDSIDDSFVYKNYPAEKQRVLSDEIMKIMTIDRNYCNIGEVEHPFTTNFSKHDVRITTHYYENNLVSSFYSVIHEGGHALYELHTSDDIIGSPLATGASMGIHESQSRLFENIIGRSRSFVTAILPIIKKIFPEQLAGVDEDKFYKAINKSVPSLIRTDADELTYSFHILIRYELEKRLINGSLSVDDLPAEWNKLYKEYLGIDVPSDSVGVLQDVHWGGGMIGYFPSYAIGSAYGAQIIASMKKDVEVERCIANGDLQPIVDWLTDKIWQYGLVKKPNELILSACGAEFDPQYYIDYITEKINSIYGF